MLKRDVECREMVEFLQHRLVRDPIPVARGVEAFFRARHQSWAKPKGSLGSWDVGLNDGQAEFAFGRIGRQWNDVDQVEIWIDPLLNSRLIGLQFLAWLQNSGHDQKKLRIMETSRPLGGMRWEHLTAVQGRELSAGELDSGVAAWVALSFGNPEALADFRNATSVPLSFVTKAVEGMLNELPDEASLLSGSEREVLSHIDGAKTVEEIIRHAVGTLDYFEVGRVLELFRDAETPLIAGLSKGQFDLYLHDRPPALWDFMNTRPQLTRFGEAVLEARESYRAPVSFRRWWGGVQLSANPQWRWNNHAGEVVRGHLSAL